MVIHRRTLPDAPTKALTVSGYLWGRRPRRRIAYNFDAVSPRYGSMIRPPYVDIETAFFLPSASQPEVFDTIIRIAGYTLLVTAYFDNRLGPNPNLKRDFPLLPWKGEIAVLFIGKRKSYVARAPPVSVIRFAIAQYMGVSIAHAEMGVPFPSYMKCDGSGTGVSAVFAED